uniref:F-box domain-containing protein n=1 Tax=Mycena chlorophos TaxID=658473 RepID=A0ABQ0LQ23_MYCCL|nr:predicted protein [Mycena chlorophos]
MHRALQIPEVVMHICETLGADFLIYDRVAQGALAALARVCRRFSEPAFDALWAKQGSVEGFLGLFPDDLWDDPWDRFYRWDLQRAILPADWQRPLFYTHRVKSLILTDAQDLPSIKVQRVLAICLPPGTSVLFPNLRQLEWGAPIVDKCYPFLPLLLGPRISELKIDSPQFVEFLSLLPTIPIRCPDLRIVDIGSEQAAVDMHGPLRETFSLLVRQLRGVESLWADDIDPAAFEHLSRLPSLKTLRLAWIGVAPLDITLPDSPPEEPLFASLTALEIFPCATEIMLLLLDATSRSPLKTLEITVQCGFSPPAVASVISRVCSAAYRDTLELFYLEATQKGSYPEFALDHLALPFPENETAMSTDALRSLINAGFTKLDSLQLDVPGGFDLDDALLLDIAAAWGATLRSLKLYAEDLSAPSHRVTLEGIHAMACRCPALWALDLQLSAVDIPTPADPLSASGPALQGLRVGFSPIRDAPAVAQFLMQAFPALEGVWYWRDFRRRAARGPWEDRTQQERDGKIYRRRWREVKQIIRAARNMVDEDWQSTDSEADQ